MDRLAVAAACQVDPDTGLESDAAEQCLFRFGPNVLASSSPAARWRRVVDELNGPIVTLLLVAAAISTLAWSLEGRDVCPSRPTLAWSWWSQSLRLV